MIRNKRGVLAAQQLAGKFEDLVAVPGIFGRSVQLAARDDPKRQIQRSVWLLERFPCLDARSQAAF